jgi:cellulose synthase/poly-beta-1,6-N-acetylglucosamine synthase-like glycosyltransferase/CheY-like chemotaxis protein
MNTKADLIQGSILVVDDDPSILQFVSLSLKKEGYEVTLASDGKDALLKIEEALPDLIISDLNMPEMDGLSLLKFLRSQKNTKSIPIILLTTRGSTSDIVTGLNLGADDYLPKPFKIEELLARVKSKMERPPVPVEDLPQDRQTGLLSEQLFGEEASREIARASRGGNPGCLAFLYINELPRLMDRLGSRAERAVAKQIAEIIGAEKNPLEIIGHDPKGMFLILLPEVDSIAVKKRLMNISRNVADTNYFAEGEHLRLTPTIGFCMFKSGDSYPEVRKKALSALEYSESQLDLEPKGYDDKVQRFEEKKAAQTQQKISPWSAFKVNFRAPFQIIFTLILSLVVPYLFYFLMDRYLVDISKVIYIIVVIALLTTGLMIWIEGFFALKRKDPPEEPGKPYPPASAIIAAYLPNEAMTIVETVESFLKIEYPAPLQIIVAYNTPRDMPIEKVLQEIAAVDPRLVPMRVEGSESKAQNVNAAIARITGEFVGVFDADHHPQPDSFTRAWRWLSQGCEIVQGHCQVRNGDSSWVARMVAVEFEAIYAVSHPGRTRLYGFGVFGGSNGYWKTDLLRETRMHGFMLTEDIDSSMRVTEAGHIIVTDPYLVSRELAPGTIKALWNQRMRWAQGWFQVSREHLMYAIRSKKLNLRQKIGAIYLLGWREVYPWLTVQMFPIIAFWVTKYGGLNKIDWLIPIFVLTTIFTLSVGPGQTFLSYLLGAEEIKKNKGWYFSYLILTSLFYTEFKNIIARVAQVKEIMGERSWRITPRDKN